MIYEGRKKVKNPKKENHHWKNQDYDIKNIEDQIVNYEDNF